MNLKTLFCMIGFALLAGLVYANAARDTLVSDLASQAKRDNPGFSGFSAERGRVFYLAKQTGGKPGTPSCTSCHTNSLKNHGQTPTGKDIAPLAVSLEPTRYTDREKADLWFKRNCNSVLGRACTALEKGDFLAFAMSQ